MSEAIPHPTANAGQMEGYSNLPLPIEMQLFAAWETRRIPSNCVSRTCTLTLSHLAVFEQVEPGLNFIVISVSMKTPRRFLRSNEIFLPTSGMVDIPLKLMFTHQYPHFLKRNGNELQIRLQRRKRTIRGYKTLAEGSIVMSTVLQRNIIKEVLPLYCTLSGKYNFQHVANITIESLTSTPSSSRIQPTVEDNSSEEDDEELFEEVVERNLSEVEAYDSSAENDRDMFPTQRNRSIKLPFLNKPSRTVMSLLRRKPRKEQEPGDLDMSQEDEEGDLDPTDMQFVSDVSDSNSDDDELLDDPPIGSKHSTPRPQLRPLYTSDITSMTSLFTSSRRGSMQSISSNSKALLVSTTPHINSKTLGTSV